MHPAVEFINSLSPKLREKALRAIELLKEFGFRLGEPHATSGYIKKEMKTDQGEIENAQKLRKIFIEEMA